MYEYFTESLDKRAFEQVKMNNKLPFPSNILGLHINRRRGKIGK
jgi:hypothetical protein